MPSATTSASEPDRVEVVTSVQRRRRWSFRLLGKKTLENEILQQALALAKSKKLLSHAPWRPEEGSR